MTYSLNNISLPSVVTIGTFDGVHIGHQKILRKLLQSANDKQMNSVVLTMFPHPRMVLQKESNIKLLLTIDERIEMLKHFGIENIVVKEFTQEFANLTPLEYVEDILVNELNAHQLIIGYDHHFGKNRSANIDDLKNFGKQFNFEVAEISALEVEEVAVSSTKIRKSLSIGDIETANAFLGYNYFVTGTVVKGRGIGRTINFPTANIFVNEDYKLIPKNGVYVVKSTIDNKSVYGMMNIGTKPTVDGENQSIEVNFLNLNKDLYGFNLKIEMLHRLRDEVKFESLHKLQEQLQLDRLETEAYIRYHSLNE